MPDLKWSRTSIVEPGWYWVRTAGQDRATGHIWGITRIIRFDERLRPVDDGGWSKVVDVVEEWSGPIPEPKE